MIGSGFSAFRRKFNNRKDEEGNFKMSTADRFNGVAASLIDLDRGGNRFGQHQDRMTRLQDDFRSRAETQGTLDKIKAMSANMTPEQQALAEASPDAFMKLHGANLFPNQANLRAQAEDTRRFDITSGQADSRIANTASQNDATNAYRSSVANIKADQFDKTFAAQSARDKINSIVAQNDGTTADIKNFREAVDTGYNGSFAQYTNMRRLIQKPSKQNASSNVQDGQRIQNPETGEEMILFNGQWVTAD